MYNEIMKTKMTAHLMKQFLEQDNPVHKGQIVLDETRINPRKILENF